MLLARELVGRGRSVVAISRRRERLEEIFRGEPRITIATADALDEAATERAAADCDLIVDCIGLPPERMADHPRTARIIGRVAAAVGARCLQVSSYWSFFPHRGEVVDERHPRDGGHEWFRLRREAEDVMLEAGAAVIHLPDFFGPEVHTSSVQMALEAAAAGEPIQWLGSASTPREAAFLPDALRIAAELVEYEEAYGTDWAIPGSGPLTADRLAEIAAEHLGREVTVRAAPGWLLSVLTLIVPALRRIRPVVPHYVRPVRYDTSKLRGLLGEVETTPFEEAIPRTLDWITGRQAAAG
jgi:nucleoside-diphosphate-sugar epimerase